MNGIDNILNSFSSNKIKKRHEENETDKIHKKAISKRCMIHQRSLNKV